MTSHDTNGRLREWMAAALACTLEPRTALYVSTPITTGARFVAWRRGPGAALDPASEEYHHERLARVVTPNREAVVALVAETRERVGEPVIDPTTLEDVPGWQQFDYHRFWVDVIERFAHAVVFVDGWEYSSGCVLELAAAARCRLALLRPDGTTLPRAEARQLVHAAIDDVRGDAVLPTEPLEAALSALDAEHGPLPSGASSGVPAR
jgi:hypothetical protein